LEFSIHGFPVFKAQFYPWLPITTQQKTMGSRDLVKVLRLGMSPSYKNYLTNFGRNKKLLEFFLKRKILKRVSKTGRVAINSIKKSYHFFANLKRINHHNLEFGQIYNLGPKVTNTNLEFGFKIKITSVNLVEKGCE